MSYTPTKALLVSEAPIFVQSTPCRSGASLPRCDVPAVDVARLWPAALLRKQPPGLPEVSEPEVVRHYTRASLWNFNIDKGMYPLGSCTMKYNPKSADAAAEMSAFSALHPYQPASLMQGALQLMYELEQMLGAIGGFPRVTLQPSAGAQGELCGLMMIRAYHQDRKRSPSRILVPDSAHGTNPASCTVNGFTTVPLKTDEDGAVTPDEVRRAIRQCGPQDVAGIMITNPSTLGLFEVHIAEIAELVHAAGGLVYMDGANLNALMGRFRPGDAGVDVMHFNLHKTFGTPHGGGGPGAGPVGVARDLVPFLPVPTVERDDDGSFRLRHDHTRSIGQLRAFCGNFGVLLRAYAYILEMGPDGLKQATEMAVLNANYLRVQLREFLHVPHPHRCMHEVVASDHDLKETTVTTLDIAKRLMDYGFHPPTVYFPLVVHGALMVEPTETETPQTLDCFVEAMRAIVREAHEQPELVKTAPHTAGLGRLDEVTAARKPRLRWTAE